MSGGQRRRGPAPGKRQDILRAASSVFAELGYTGASIEIIADHAGVSTRTIYNHFANKAALFQVTIERSATRVAEAQIEIVQKYLDPPAKKTENVEELLITFATEWTRPLPDYTEHRALVEQVRAEVGRIPARALDAWQEAGPLRVRRKLAEMFAALAERGVLQLNDPVSAATHFTRLVAVDDPLRPGRRMTKKQSAAVIVGGVHAFLYGYAARGSGTK